MSNTLPFPADPAQEVRVPVEPLQTLVEQLLTKFSMFQFDATVAARRIIEADLYGVPSHGCALLDRLLTSLDLGDVDPRGRILTLRETPVFAVLDGSRALGHVAGTKATELAIAKARETGLGLVVVGNSQTLGAAELFVRLIAQAGQIGLCCTSTGGATVTIPGSHAGATGNCALAYAVPVADSHPLVFDSSCGADTFSKFSLLKRYGLPIPEGLLRDSAGAPTSDLSQGLLAPRGETLGFGLSLICSILAGPLAGGWMPLHKKRRTDAEDSQHVFVAIDPDQFCDPVQFQGELTATLQKIRALPPIDPQQPIRLPGDRGIACYADAMQHGIPLHQSVAEEIKTRAIKKKLTVPW
jgi:LDH2 family malate/lactate/ureidoglycolate dehydrogenase